MMGERIGTDLGLDSTVKWMPKWIDNMLAHRDSWRTEDVTEWRPPPGIKRVVLVGTGPSFASYERKEGDFIVGNQSSALLINLDACVVTDAGRAVEEKLNDANNANRIVKRAVLFEATLADPGLKRFFREGKTFHFHHPPVDGIPILSMIFDKLCPKTVKTCIVQVGNSMNAALLLFAHLMETGIMKKVPIHLAGVDFAHYGGIQTPEFVDYAKDNRRIVKALDEAGFELTMEKTPGPLKGWIKVV